LGEKNYGLTVTLVYVSYAKVKFKLFGPRDT
jgi:hypothetical protein